LAFSVLDKYTVKVPTIVGNKNRNVSVITPNISSQFSIPKSSLKITAYIVGIENAINVVFNVLFIVQSIGVGISYLI
jgi:hypothetical protein